jgi:hypothetical protein
MTDLFEGLKLPTGPRRPSEPIVREALVEDGCRFWLKRAWGAGPMVLWAMCNPSDADGLRDDPTMLRVMEFSMAWGFGSCAVINVVPLISSTPKVALDWAAQIEKTEPSFEVEVWDQWNSNIYHCTKLLWQAQAHVAAWGNILPERAVATWWDGIVWSPEGPDHDDTDIAPFPGWLCLGKTKSGAPKHPLARGKHRVPADFKPVPFKTPVT